MILNYSETTTLYFFSTAAQSVASIVGLSAAVAVFRYQYYLKDLEDKREHILQLIKLDKYLDMFPLEVFQEYNKLTSNRERVEWWRPRFRDAYANVLSEDLNVWLDRQVSKMGWAGKTEAHKQDFRNGLLIRYQDNWLEYEALDIIISQAENFKKSVFVMTKYGLALVCFGVVGTLFPAANGWGTGGQIAAKILFMGGLGLYFWKLFGLIKQAFE